MGFVMLLRARGKERVERVSIAGIAQWLNQSFADAPVGRCANPAIDTRSTQALRHAPRSITKLIAVIEASP